MICTHDFWAANEVFMPDDYERELKFYGLSTNQQLAICIRELEKSQGKKKLRFYKVFSLVLIKKFERKISLIIVFLNKFERKVFKDFRFYFVGV